MRSGANLPGSPTTLWPGARFLVHSFFMLVSCPVRQLRTSSQGCHEA